MEEVAATAEETGCYVGGTDERNWRTGRQSKQKDRWVGVRRADGGAGRAVGWTVRQADELSGQGGG